MTDLNHLLQSIKERADRAPIDPWRSWDSRSNRAAIIEIMAEHKRLVEAVRVLAGFAKEIEAYGEHNSLDAYDALQRATEILKGV